MGAASGAAAATTASSSTCRDSSSSSSSSRSRSRLHAVPLQLAQRIEVLGSLSLMLRDDMRLQLQQVCKAPAAARDGAGVRLAGWAHLACMPATSSATAAPAPASAAAASSSSPSLWALLLLMRSINVPG